jgi:uncharacterized protein
MTIHGRKDAVKSSETVTYYLQSTSQVKQKYPAPWIPFRTALATKCFELELGGLCSVLFGVFALCFVTQSFAASFDCRHAKTATEKAVCSDWRLTTFDEVLATRYRQALQKVEDSVRVKADQRKWLDLRNACDPDSSCLGRAYETRLAELGFDYLDFDGDIPLMRCDGTAETVIITRVAQTNAKTDPSSATRVPKGTVSYLKVSPDKRYDECRFASGRSIRVKVGAYEPYPYGHCGADPGSFFSAWVDQKKMASRVGLRGNCGFEVLVKAEVSRDTLNTCYMSMDGKLDCSSKRFAISDQPDLEEYPLRPTNKGPIGGYVTEYAADSALCKGMLFGPTDDPKSPYWHIAPPMTATYFDDGVQQPSGGPTTKVLTSRFDMNNDGKPDSVVAFQFDSRQRESSTFFAHRANVSEKEVTDIDAEFLRNGSFAVYPHNWGNCSGGFNRDDWDDENCTIPLEHFAPRGRPFAYDIQSLTLYPFQNGKTTYFLGLGRHYLSESVAAVWEPRPSGNAREVCIFRRSVENY